MRCTLKLPRIEGELIKENVLLCANGGVFAKSVMVFNPKYSSVIRSISAGKTLHGPWKVRSVQLCFGQCKYFLILTECFIYTNATVRCSITVHPQSVGEKQDIVVMFLLIHGHYQQISLFSFSMPWVLWLGRLLF